MNRLFPSVLLFLSLGHTAFGQPKQLRLVTVNSWSGLDYQGFLRFGEYESPQRRRLRFQSLVHQIRTLDPDVVFIQEANLLPGYASRLAKELVLKEIHHICNAGIHFGPLGVPVNFREGLVILARPSLLLEVVDVWKLSGAFGIYGDLITVHFNESIFALAGKIMLEDTPVYLVNVHLVASPAQDSSVYEEGKVLLQNGRIGEDEYRRAVKKWLSRVERRQREMRRLLNHMKRLPSDSPVLVAGDFNTERETPEIETFTINSSFFDADPHESTGETWDPSGNENIAYSTSDIDARNRRRSGYDLLSALASKQGALIDHIFLNERFGPDDVLDSRRILDEKVDGIHVSDHYGLLADIDMTRVLQDSPKEVDTITPLRKATIEPLPILMYDTDVGFGYGAKLFLLNLLRRNESLDLTAFNSTKGERWYQLILSLPDFERRQGKIYPLAIDFLVNYDKWIRNSFFGAGNRSRYDDRESYTKEPLEISLTLSRGFTARFVGQVGVKYKTTRNYNFEDDSRLEHLEPDLNASRATFHSFYLGARQDTRDSFINPSRGYLVQGEAEVAPWSRAVNIKFTRQALRCQWYSVLFYPRTVLATRLEFQNLTGKDLPVQVLLPIGGNRTLRGYSQDRFLDKAAALANLELRYPIFRRLGGVFAVDAGKVWNSPPKIDFNRWAWDFTSGLRLYMKTFVVRVDIGFSKETTGFYFNFGHIF